MTTPLRLVVRYSASHRGVARWLVELVCGHSFFLNGSEGGSWQTRLRYRPQYTQVGCIECAS